MPQLHELGSLSTDSIRAKLGDLVEDTNDINNFDKAVAALKNKRSTFVPYRGNGGSVAEARSQVSRLQEELDRAEGKRETLSAVQAEIVELEQRQQRSERELADVREQITRGAQAAAAAAVRQQYENLCAQRGACAAAVGESRFADGMPSAADFEAARQSCEAYLSLSAQLQNTGLSDAEQAQLAQLNRFFAPGIPDEQKLEELSRQHRGVLQLRTVAENQKLSAGEQRQKEELSNRFEGCNVDQEILDEAGASLERAAWLRRENQRLAGEQNTQPAPKKSGKTAVLALILGILALAAGITLLAAGQYLPGGIVLGLGVLALIGAAYLGVKQMISRELGSRGSNADLQRRIDANEAEAARLEEQVFAVTRHFAAAQPSEEVLARIRTDYGRYQSLLGHERELDETRRKTLGKLQACEEALSRELIPYFGENAEYEQAIWQLRMKRGQLLDLRAKQDAAQTCRDALWQRGKVLREQLEGFLNPYFDVVEPQQFHSLLSQLERQCDEYHRIRSRLTELESQLAAFRAEHGDVLGAATGADIPDLDALKQTEKQLSGEISGLTREILERRQLAGQLRREFDRIPEIRDGLEHWQERKDTDMKNAETLDETLEFLQKAKESLSGNYLGTIQRSFAELLGRMMGEEADKILLTGDLEVQLERQGQARELAFFSAGQTDMVMLCMRFALVDALFSEVKPFIILDDPFVNLDDTRTAEALALLQELAQERQIIYLVCNSSRV